MERVTDPEALSSFFDDAAHVPGGHTSEVVVPRSERAIAEVLTAARAVLPVGAQSSLTGGATPRGEVVLSTGRFRTCAVDGDAHLVAGAGLTLLEVGETLRGRHAMYPPAPTFLGATVGGSVATNAAGAATFKYGTTRQWVDGVTVVLACGEVLDLQRGKHRAHPEGYFEVTMSSGIVRVPVPRYVMPRVPKLSAGYFSEPGMDLVDLFIGSEGTLGVVTQARLRTQSPAPATCLVFVTFRERDPALAFVAALRTESQRTWQASDAAGLDISAIEHMDARSLSLLREDGVDVRLGIALDARSAMGLLIALDLPPNTTTQAVFDAFAGGGGRSVQGVARFVELLDAHGSLDDAIVAAPGDVAGRERLLALREAVPLAVNARVGQARRDVDARIEKTAADVIVPFEHVGALLEVYEREWQARGLDGAIWGHISDGNVHPNVIPRRYSDVVSGKEAMLVFGREAIRMGGAPLAEHGVGRNVVKQQLLVELYGSDGLAQMRDVKRALDPEGKLAPGVLFPAG